MSGRHSSAFVGFGQSRLFRHDEVPLGELALEASRAALEDAGLSPADVDGVACVPAPPFEIEGTQTDGIHYVSTSYMASALGIVPRWRQDLHGAMVINSTIHAIAAVESGRCETALVFRALHSPSGRYGHTGEDSASGLAQFSTPYGSFGPSRLAGQLWHRYRDKYRSGTREQMATFVCKAREHGLLYEQGYWTMVGAGQLSVEEYLEGRIVSSPACIFDCDLPLQGAAAFVITTNERAKNLRQRPAYVRGVGVSTNPTLHSIYDLRLDSQLLAARETARNLWEDSGLTISDVDVADIYDGFSMLTIVWIDGLGFCKEGEAFDYIQDGRIALDGEMPLNPSGGNLGAGRLHGCNQIMDAMLQVTGRSGARQVKDAAIALAAVGPPSLSSGTLLLGRDPT